MPDDQTPPAPPADKTYTQAEVDALTTGLKSKNTELIGKVKSATERASILGDRTAEDVQADLDLAKVTRENKAKAEGDFETLKSSLLEGHKKELEKVSGRTQKLEQKLYDQTARREAVEALVAAGDKTTPVIMLPHVLPFVKVAEAEEDYVTTVVDAKGKQRYVNGEPMTVAQLVDEFKGKEEFGGAFPASGTSGSGAAASAATGGRGGEVILSRADAQNTQKYRAAKADADKRGVPLRIAAS